MRGTLFLQPHSDDVVISLFYHIKREFFRRPYYLVTVFSKSDWVDPVQRVFLSKKIKRFNQKEVTKLRKKEDKKFANKMSMDLFHLELSDSKIRHGKAIFNPNYKIDEGEYKIVSEKINDLLNKISPESVVFPAPTGPRQHIDHRIVNQIGLDLLIPNKYINDDLPYSVIENPIGKEHLIKYNNLIDKFEALNIYGSQVNYYFFEDLIRFGKINNSCERVFKIL